MRNIGNWSFPLQPNEEAPRAETLPYRPEQPRPDDPLLGIDSFAPEFWRLVKDEPRGPVPLATPTLKTAEGVPPVAPPMDEISIVSSRPKMRLTDDEITNILVNEAISLSGPGVEEMRRQMAQTIMNADESFGERRGNLAKTKPTVVNRRLSSAEEKMRDAVRINVAEARQRFERGEDPTNLATNFIKREDTGAPPLKHDPAWAAPGELRLESIQGPFPDSQKNGEPAKFVYLWQNAAADKYYGRNRK